MAPTQSRLAHKLDQISFRSKSTFGILSSYNRPNKNADTSFRNKSSKHKAKMLKSIWQGNCFNSRISKFNRYIKCHSRGRDPSIPVCKKTTNVPDQMSSELLKSQKNYQKMVALPKVCEEEITWWIHQLDQWNWKQIRMSVNLDLTIETDASKTGWGAVCPALSVTMGGPWSVSVKELYINALEMKAVQFAVKATTKESKNIHVQRRTTKRQLLI